MHKKTILKIKEYILNIKSRIKRNKINVLTEFYPISSTCQIPKLEVYYLNYFGKRMDGYFVEVGAYDGDMVSNTSGLADIGWHGLYIEPIPLYYEKCKERHQFNTNVEVLNLAISNIEEMLTFSLGGVLSTARADVRENFEKIGWKNFFEKSDTIQTMALPLDLVLKQNSIPKSFDLLVIDVEGFEFKVMQGFGIANWRPKMIIIELHDQNRNYRSMLSESFRISRMIQDCNYRVIFKNLSNTIYVADEIYDLSKE